MLASIVIGAIYLADYRKSKQLWDHGARVLGVVSDKHHINGRAGRLFFQPPPDLTEAHRELWAQTSIATRYPDWGELFDDWNNRLWIDVGPETYGATQMGRGIALRIDGRTAMVAKLSAPGTLNFWILGGLFAAGAWMLGSGMRAGWREDKRTLERKQRRRQRRSGNST